MSTSLNPNNYKLGYYQVGEKIHANKIMALIDGSERNIHPQWKFNDEVFDSVNWSIEPSESILELYKQRALALREKYDYLMLMYSGGSDSHTILQSFINNGIKLDEVVVSWATGLAGTYTPDQSNLDPYNGLSEWDFNIKPKLEYLSKHHPEIKLTVYNWVDKIKDHKVEDDYILDRNHQFSPYVSARWFFTEYAPIREQLEKRDSIALIIGADKPRVCFHNNAYQLYFLDIVASDTGPHCSAKLLKDDLHIEFFYWSPDATKLIAKQAHMLIDYFDSMPNFKQFITWPVKFAHRQFYESSTRAIVYPNWDLNTFQVNKMTDMNTGYDKLLFPLGLETKIRGLQRDNFDYLRTVVDPKYFNDINGVTTLVGMISKMRKVRDPRKF